jgi:hypothetical protein
MANNGERLRITKKMPQGIHLVKCTGLEFVFLKWINKTQESQLGYICWYLYISPIVYDILPCMEILVTAATFSTCALGERVESNPVASIIYVLVTVLEICASAAHLFREIFLTTAESSFRSSASAASSLTLRWSRTWNTRALSPPPHQA